jgi:4-methyl-5(b-hydroxyethyl)-thiazole monophosphate biosynthesis
VRQDPILVLLAPGFDEVAVVTVAQTLRRSGFHVELVGLTAGPVRGGYGLSLTPDKSLSEVEEDESVAIVLPGGKEGARRLNADPRVHGLLRRAFEQGAYVAALDAAQLVLRTAGLLDMTQEALKGATIIERSAMEASSQLGAVKIPLVLRRGSEAARESAQRLVALLQSG